MKRLGKLFDKIIDIDNIILAHKNARKGKSDKAAVQMIDSDIMGYCTKIQQMLIDKTYTTAEYNVFKITDKGKEREIAELPYYPDRIIQWAVLQILSPMFCSHFIAQTYAAIPGKGTHAALTKLREYMTDKEATAYCLKFDVKKYFQNIDKDILKALLRRKIKCADTLWLLDDIVDSFPEGIPIGNYSSQYFGNYYLSFFDHWLKEVKRVKYYLRYMDDIVILHADKIYLHKLKCEIEEYLTVNLKLRIKENWAIFPTLKRGVDFVGYRAFDDYTLLRNKTKKRLKTATKKLQRKVNSGKKFNLSDRSRIGSYLGILGWCDGHRLLAKTINKFLGGIYANSKRNAKRQAA